ncbi:MAG: anti-anti-sigma factor [Actinobacteria bacterium HGW-Actinobacteria-2]|nr:MAG: anti-anti-sigma factor [Actinobacteria bacterium HGW-Actinobacteria-2]
MSYPIDELGTDVGVIRVDGRLNMVTASQLKDTVADAVGTGRLRVVVDLTNTTFMDSSGLGALISGLKTARTAGGDLRIAGANEQVLMVLQLSNMDRILRPYETPESAFAD